MLDVFHSEDGVFHQAVLSLNKLNLVRLVVERLSVTGDYLEEWEWTVWPVRQDWESDPAPVSGCESSLSHAKRRAFDSGISMLGNLMRDQDSGLPAPMGIRPHMHSLRTNAALRRA